MKKKRSADYDKKMYEDSGNEWPTDPTFWDHTDVAIRSREVFRDGMGAFLRAHEEVQEEEEELRRAEEIEKNKKNKKSE